MVYLGEQIRARVSYELFQCLYVLPTLTENIADFN